jgi:hypothetical protein
VRRAILHALVALGPLALAGCGGAPAGNGSGNGPDTVTLTRIGSAVQITENGERARECEYVADLPLQSSSASDANAMRALRNDAGEAGANLVLLVMETRTTVARAEGYLCAD